MKDCKQEVLSKKRSWWKMVNKNNHLYEQSEYYSGSVAGCPVSNICHEGKGNIGFICRHFVAFHCLNTSYVECSCNTAVQLTLDF